MNERSGRWADGRRKSERDSYDSQIGSEFRQLLVWQKAQDMAQAVSEAIENLPRSRATDAIASQMMRAAGSISANIAEGYGRDSQVAFREHLGRSRGLAFEVESWLDLLVRRRDISEAAASRLVSACKEVERLISEKMKSLEVLKNFPAGEARDRSHR